jgi:hypothetical protein
MEDLTIDLSHQLEPDELKRRMERGVAKLPSYIPGGIAQVHHSWPSEDRMALEVRTFGQVIPAHVDLMLGRVRVTLRLPGMLKLMAGPIEAMVRKSGEQLLLEKPAQGSKN